MNYQGIDVSNVNGSVDWARVASSGVDFAHGKATEGVSFVDGKFAQNRQSAKGYGIHFGAYHFGRPDNRPTADGARQEATHFCQVVGKVYRGELRPVLDLEVGSGDLTVWAGAFLSEVEKRLGVRPLLYSYTSFIRSHLRLSALPGYGLWVADYGVNDGTEHPVSLSNVEHQYTSRGVVSGVIGHVDRNSAPSLAPLMIPTVPGPTPLPQPVSESHPESKNGYPFTRPVWPVPIPAWFWHWAQWRQDGETYQRPLDAPKVIPPWAWARLAQL